MCQLTVRRSGLLVAVRSLGGDDDVTNFGGGGDTEYEMARNRASSGR
jgi:hypothetical protein